MIDKVRGFVEFQAGRGIKIKIKLFGFFGGLLCFALY